MRPKSAYEKRVAAAVTKFVRKHRGLNKWAVELAVDRAGVDSLSDRAIRDLYIPALAFSEGTDGGMLALEKGLKRGRPTLAQENAQLARMQRHAVIAGFTPARAKTIAAENIDSFVEYWEEAFRNS